MGAYQWDKRHGYGEMYWVDGTIYKGQWEFGVEHGHGKLHLPNGQIKDGLFENNIYKGAIFEKAEEGQ